MEHKKQNFSTYHSQDTRYTGPLETAPTVNATYGMGSNNQPFVVEPETPKMLKMEQGAMTAEEYGQIDTIFREKYRPILVSLQNEMSGYKADSMASCDTDKEG